MPEEIREIKVIRKIIDRFGFRSEGTVFVASDSVTSVSVASVDAVDVEVTSEVLLVFSVDAGLFSSIVQEGSKTREITKK